MRTLSLLGLRTLCSATPVLAQATPSAPAVDISGGSAFLNDVTAEESFHGWLAAVGFNVSDPLAIVVEFGRHAKDLDALDLGIAEVSISSLRFSATIRATDRLRRSMIGARVGLGR